MEVVSGEDTGMDLRPELLPPSVAPQRLAEISREIGRIRGLLDDREPTEAAIAAFNEMTGHDYTADDFAHYWRSRNLEEFAREAARPAPARVPDISRDELAEIVRRILAADPETDYYLRLFEANVPHPAASDLIYWPPAELGDASAEQIVDAALSHRPIALGPGGSQSVG
ncbi:hypothetical protein ABZ801_29835 [Actinomadura sp. NPDC047616]|uniref:hypothetical protein n=1 Tax=Actinomadura sp. NPDC047616 TaxID=3155914 RepID=UPI0033D3A109